MKIVKLHTLPLNYGSTFYMNDGNAIRECTFVGVGTVYTDCNLAVIYYFDENNRFCSMKKCVSTEHVTFHMTLEDAILNKNNILKRYVSILNESAIREFIENNGFKMANNHLSLIGYIFKNNAVQEVACHCDIVLNHLGIPSIKPHKVYMTFNTYLEPYFSIRDCIKNNMPNIKLRKEQPQKKVVNVECVFRGQIEVEVGNENTHDAIIKALQDGINVPTLRLAKLNLKGN